MKPYRIVAIFLSALLIAGAIPIPSSVSGGSEKITVTKGETTNFGGGNYLEVKHGSTRVGVVYGTLTHPNHIIIYTSGEMSMGEIESFEGSRLVKKETVNSEALITTEILGITEFRDINNNSRFESFLGKNGGYKLTGLDYPVKKMEFRNNPEIFPKIEEIGDGGLSVSFKFAYLNPRYNLQWNDMKGRMIEVDGKKVADTIFIDFQINFTYKHKDISQALYTVSDSSLKKHGEGSREGLISDISVKYSYNIRGWDFSYPDSKLLIESRNGFFYQKESYGLVEKGLYANITTYSPRYLELNGSEPIPGLRPIYGHSIRAILEDKKIGTLSGSRISVVNGNNTTYIDMLAGEYPENTDFYGENYGGFVLPTSCACRQGNLSSARDISLEYISVSPFVPADATPSWANALPFELAAIIFLGLYISIKRYR